ncbi:polysaccharide biosynthesis/export family protein [Amorphus sp. 3PC139-8]|uniref:polysaccharide biosynthesis/export family protein n=1 Tax=Amorphus sp. 3PC139-8 TaxID=2735676 RepID=UPI00345C95C7
MAASDAPQEPCAQSLRSSTRLTGCVGNTSGDEPVAIVPTAYAAPATVPGFRPWTDAVEYQFRFVIGDQVTINLPFYDDESTETQVAPDGMIYLSLIGGVPAEGRTPKELEQELEKRYRKYLRYPTVGVVPTSFGARQVFVGGEVNEPGALTMPGPLGVMEAVIMAGGMKDTAGTNKIVLIRRGPDDKPMLRVVDLAQFAGSADPNENLILQPYDIVFVPRSRIAEVNLWVDQYINKTLPFSSNFSYAIQRNVY